MEIIKQMKLAGRIDYYLKRLGGELTEICTPNPSAQEIRVPIILLHGAKDFISRPSKIIPVQEKRKSSSYIKKIHEREQFLQKHLFPKSSSIKRIDRHVAKE
jgi:hypothetical protein